MLNRFHGCKANHTTACNEVFLDTIKVRMLPNYGPIELLRAGLMAKTLGI